MLSRFVCQSMVAVPILASLVSNQSSAQLADLAPGGVGQTSQRRGPVQRSSKKRLSLIPLTTIVCLLFPGISWAGTWGQNWGTLIWGSQVVGIPTLTDWGLVVAVAGLLVAGYLMLRRHRQVSQ